MSDIPGCLAPQMHALSGRCCQDTLAGAGYTISREVKTQQALHIYVYTKLDTGDIPQTDVKPLLILNTLNVPSITPDTLCSSLNKHVRPTGISNWKLCACRQNMNKHIYIVMHAMANVFFISIDGPDLTTSSTLSIASSVRTLQPSDP